MNVLFQIKMLTPAHRKSPPYLCYVLAKRKQRKVQVQSAILVPKLVCLFLTSQLFLSADDCSQIAVFQKVSFIAFSPTFSQEEQTTNPWSCDGRLLGGLELWAQRLLQGHHSCDSPAIPDSLSITIKETYVILMNKNQKGFTQIKSWCLKRNQNGIWLFCLQFNVSSCPGDPQIHFQSTVL